MARGKWAETLLEHRLLRQGSPFMKLLRHRSHSRACRKPLAALPTLLYLMGCHPGPMPVTQDAAEMEHVVADAGRSDSTPSTGGVGTPSLTCGPGRPFPAQDRTCTNGADCVAVLHQSDCCGTVVAIGISGTQRSRFDADERACRATYQQCMCAPRQLATDDGSRLRDQAEVAVSCTEGLCTTYRAGCMGPCASGTNCFDCPDGPQKRFLCSHTCNTDTDCREMSQSTCISLLNGPFCAPQSCGTP